MAKAVSLDHHAALVRVMVLIAAADAAGLAMVFTNMRHFRH